MRTALASLDSIFTQTTLPSGCSLPLWGRHKVLIVIGFLLGVLVGGHGGSILADTPAMAAKQSVYVLAVDLKAHTITVQPVKFLTGAAAVKAYRADHPGSKEGPPNDHYTVVLKKDRAELPLAKKAIVKLVTVNGTAHTEPVAVAQSKLMGYRGITKNLDAAAPFWITSDGGVVVLVEEQFVP